MEKLKKLILLCKGSVSVVINTHKDFYEKIEDYVKTIDNSDESDLDKQVIQKMIELKTCINIHFYPDNPIGFISVWHYDLEMALDECLACFENK